MVSATLRNAQDSYTEQAKPSKNYNTVARMYVDSGRHGFLFFSRPFPARARITAARLRMYNGGGWAGVNTVSVRLVTGSWSASKINWNNQPPVGATVAQVSKTDPAAGTEWVFDLKNLMQQISDGTSWYGLRIDVNTAAGRWFHSSAAPNPDRRPRLEIEWSEDPLPPTDLSPDDGVAVSIASPVLRFDFTDVAGDTEMGGYQVQIATDPTTNTDGSFVTPIFDTLEVVDDIPQCDLAAEGFALASGQTVHWIVRVRDAGGLWSGWSDPATFRRIEKPTLTLDNPPAVDPSYVEDNTPPIIWTYSGDQESWDVRIFDGDSGVQLWKAQGSTAENSVTVPKNVLKVIGKRYRVRVRVWDTVDRIDTPTDAAYAEVERYFTLNQVAAVTPTANLTVERTQPGFPFWRLRWTSATAPDSFTVIRDGEVVESDLRPDDLLVNGAYEWTDLRVSGRQFHTWEVARVVNGQTSRDNPEVTAEIKNFAPWLYMKDGTKPIVLLEPDIDPGLTEESEVLFPQDGPPVLITSSLWGYVGKASGLLTDSALPGVLTAAQMKSRFEDMRQNRGRSVYFVWQDEAIECHIYDCTIRQIGNADGSTDYLVSFGFIQVDYDGA